MESGTLMLMLRAPRRETARGTMTAESHQSAVTAEILIVEDEPAISGFIRRGLIFEGYAASSVADGRAALDRLRDTRPDLLILDVMLPGVDGIEICRRVRASEASEVAPPLPILMLTARDSVQDRVLGLEAGADDYLIKPFAFEELLARVRALLRRTSAQQVLETSQHLTFEDLRLDPGARTVTRGDRVIELTTREFDLLTLFLRHPNQVLPRATIMSRVWGDDFFGDSNVLEVTIGNLRRELEAGGEPRLIQTVRGVGYVLRSS